MVLRCAGAVFVAILKLSEVTSMKGQSKKCNAIVIILATLGLVGVCMKLLDWKK
jgi:hypothetical protein